MGAYAAQRTRAVLTEQAGSERRAAAYDKDLWRGKSPKQIEMMAEDEAAKLDLNLNPSQLEAVQRALVDTVTLWQGPPGTGKTHTLAALIQLCVQVSAEL